ncbi:MAG: hypothetical protein ABS52_05990 [Gemmatimonadetes bacterium SCN 70-22]|nr:MAG: hypothetical protein ABS52_05990 [Gemmatimonadetes bacterium SCN 70-22]
MSLRRGNLQPAHRGYWYQDIATAYMLVRAMVERYDAVIVDRKVVDDDRLDDLEVRAAGRRVRRQFKSSQDAARPLSAQDFTATASSLRIDRLVRTHTRAGDSPADEYRLCATWAPPDAGDPLAALLEPITAPPTLVGWPIRCFRLKAELIWPTGASPIWAPLTPPTASGTAASADAGTAGGAAPVAPITRAELLDFCQRFIIELALPVASTELTAPGPFERALVEELAERVGIGRYPNHGRAPSDVAALAIALATIARTQEGSLTPSDVERELEIRVDFGRVAQAFPLDAALFHDRPTFRQALRTTALAGGHQLVIAPPGAGKSWELTRLAEELTAAGAIVARHYCYLEPGDALVERRVTTDVFFGNLLGELLDADPSLHGAGGARYAAGLGELEATLARAAATGRPVVLIVDGIDHIARVRSDTRRLGDAETDIVERLATAQVPPGVALVIGSQPGRHLEPLRERWGTALLERTVPPWLPADLAALADRQGLTRALSAVGVTSAGDMARVRSALAERADGLPLYAHYLARGLVAGLQDGTIASPDEWLDAAPATGGDVAVYYAHLYRSASAQAQVIADLLGVIDFSVTESELREMVPAFVGAWLPPALAQLASILTVATGQGGFRIFHESFRRFMTQELARQGRSPADALRPVIDWLTARGFYADAKAYRFLLPALRRADRGAEILVRVDAAFVSDSVAQAHAADAVQRNLALAADVAAERRDWPALVRCVELHRAAYTCFDESQNDWRDYWATYLTLFGPTALAERLLFDGRPTQSASDGLYACALVDDAGGIAPWQEYLALYDAGARGNANPSGLSDSEGSLTSTEAIDLAAVHGRIRLGEWRGVARRLLTYLAEVGDRFKPLFVRQLAARMARMLGPELVERMAQRADPTRPGGPRLSRRAAAVLRLGLADELARAGDDAAARAAAGRAFPDADTPALAAACVAYSAGEPDPGQPPVWSPHPGAAVDPAALPIAVGPDVHLHDAAGVRAWVAAVRLAAADPAGGPATLEAEWRRVTGVGWYRCWLRFVLGLSRAEAARYAGQAADVSGAFAELTRDVHPFRGQPRACDLWAIRLVIQESIARGLRLLCTDAEWRDALTALALAAGETSTRMDREDGGPLSTGTVLEVLLPHAADPVGGAHVRATIERLVAALEANGTYYPTHAEYAMRLARARHAAGDVAGAREAWARGAVYLGAYGWRKDVTIYDIIEGASALLAHSPERALRALADTQPLVHAVVAHTDGRSTNHAPNTWLRGVLAARIPAGLAVLARTLVEEDDPSGWVNALAVQHAAAAARGAGDPGLVDAVLATLRFEADDHDALERIDARLAPVLGLLHTDRPRAVRALRRVAAEVTGDGRRDATTAAARVVAVAEEHGLSVPRIARDSAAAGMSAASGPPSGLSSPTGHGSRRFRPDEVDRALGLREPPFVPNPTLVDLLAGLRRAAASRRWDEPGGAEHVALSLGYRLGQLVDDGREDDVGRLLRFFARDAGAWGSSQVHPLGTLADALDAGGYPGPAAIAYALAFTATRGGNGWHRLGDTTHGYLIDRAITLDPDLARQVIADEVAYALRESTYSSGITRHLVERLAAWGEPETAEAAWREALAVIRHRLPLVPAQGWFAPLRDEREPDWPDDGWSVDEALMAVLLARLGDPRLAQKVQALTGVVDAIARRPDAVAAPMRWWLGRNTPVTAVLLALEALVRAEPAPFPITTALDEVLRGYAACDLWGARRLAAALLERAGRPAAAEPSSGGAATGTTGLPAIDAARHRALRTLDTGRVLDDLESLWPALPDRVVRRLHALLTEGDHRERAHARYRLAEGRDGDAHPRTPIVPWEVELFQVALHEASCGLSAHLWSTGQWALGLEDAVVRRALPDVRLHLGLAASRAPRPPWPAAETVTEGVSLPLVLGDDDPYYAGWTRLAYLERRYLPDPNAPYGRPTEEITVLAGVVAVPLGRAVPPGAVPFVDGDAQDWWSPDGEFGGGRASVALARAEGPLVGLDRVTDWLGDTDVLVPPAALVDLLHVAAPEFGGPLVWRDDQESPAVALRTWWVRNGEALFAEPAACVGADLVIRPDLFERLCVSFGVPLRELRAVLRRPVPGRRARP